MAARHELPSQNNPENKDQKTQIGVVREEYADAMPAIAEKIGLDYEPLNQKNDKTGFRKKLFNLPFRGYLIKGKEEDLKDFRNVVGLAMDEVRVNSNPVIEQMKKHPKLTTAAAAGLLAIAAYKIIERKRQGKLPRIGLDDGKVVE